jgi:hypothetical protein
MLPLPVVLLNNAPAPVAVFWPAVLTKSVPAPTPVLKPPSVRLRREYTPIAVLYAPVVRLGRARYPSAVLPPGYPPSGGGTTAKEFGVGDSETMPSATSIIESARFGFFIS